jgi:hypothetical protein
MKKFSIFKISPDEENEYCYDCFKRDSSGKLVYGVYCDIQVDSRIDVWDDNYSMDDTIPEWLDKLVNKICPSNEQGSEEPEFWMPENELEKLEKLANKVYYVADNKLVNSDYGRKKIWFDVTRLYKLKCADYRFKPGTTESNPDFHKQNEARDEIIQKTRDAAENLVMNYDCKLSLYKEPSTEKRYLCIDVPEDNYDSIPDKASAVDVSGINLERVKLIDLFYTYDCEGMYQQKALEARNEYLKRLNWLDEFVY